MPIDRCALAAPLLAAVLFAATAGRTTGHPPEEQSQPGRPVDQPFIAQTIESLAVLVDEEYFDPQVGDGAAASLRDRLAAGSYAEVTTLESLASALSRDLYAITRDKHLTVQIVDRSATMPAASASDEAQRQEARQLKARRSNFGIQRVEILTGNVGYLKLTDFYRPEEAREALAAAMRMLRHADALLIDLRENGGGSPDTVALLGSYLFDKPGLALFEIRSRLGESRQYTTQLSLPVDGNAARPVYVLVSQYTFSAPEGFAFMVQERGRGLIVGERTAGAANPGRPYAVNDHLEATIPNGQVRIAQSGRNWEGTGVEPDLAVPAAGALQAAHIDALRRLIKQSPAGVWRDTLGRQLEAVERSGPRSE